MLTTILILLAIFQLKHFLADYLLQTSYMLGKFKATGWAAPLSAHAGVHAGATAIITGVFLALTGVAAPLSALSIGAAFMLAGFDFAVHFTMDRIKAAPGLMGRWKALSSEDYQNTSLALKHGPDYVKPLAAKKLLDNTYFWWALGFDQMIHHFTHYLIVLILVLL